MTGNGLPPGAVYRRLLVFLRPYTLQAATAGGLMLLGGLLQLPAPLLTRYLFDRVLPSGNTGQLTLFVTLIAGLLLLGTGVGTLQARLSLACRYGAEEGVRKAALARLLAAQRSWLDSQASGYLLSRLDDDIDQIHHVLLDPILTVAMQGLTLAAGVALAFYLQPRLAWVTLLSLPLFLASLVTFSRNLRRLASERQERWARFRGVLVEGLAQSLVLQASGRQRAFEERAGREAGAALTMARRTEWAQVLAGSLTGLIAAALPLFVLWYGVHEIMVGHFTIGGFIAFNTCIGYLYGPVRALVDLRLDLHTALAAGSRIVALLDAPEASSAFGITPLNSFERLDVSGVSFTYEDGASRGCRGVTLSLHRGESVALVGPSGSGKSTFLRVVLGFAQPEAGHLTINGRDYRNYRLESLRARIGYVPQEPELFQGTLLENLVLFESGPDHAWIQWLLDACRLNASLRRFPRGLDTPVQEAGSSLSGGEKQRFAIARALYSKPELLLLDEATSAMDPDTESALVNVLLTLPWKPAILFATHRHGILPAFDQVITLTPGEIPQG
jgi:subfamily B ATP-binding cassette protein MsbA